MPIAPAMQPRSSDDASIEEYASVLLLGDPKVGKTSCAVGTSPGPVLVINSDRAGATRSAKKVYPDVKFWQLDAYSRSDMEGCLVTARAWAREKKIKTIVWDPISSFAANLEKECADKTKNPAGEPDGRRYWPVYTKYLVEVCSRLMTMDAHVIVCSHYIDTGGESMGDNPIAKTGPGIVPLLGRAARVLVAKEFDDVLFLKKKALSNDRVLCTSEFGVFGPGGRSTMGAEELPPDMTEFFRVAGLKGFAASPKKTNVKPMMPKMGGVKK